MLVIFCHLSEYRKTVYYCKKYNIYNYNIEGCCRTPLLGASKEGPPALHCHIIDVEVWQWWQWLNQGSCKAAGTC